MKRINSIVNLRNDEIEKTKSILNLFDKQDLRESLGNNTDITNIGKVLNVLGENLRTPYNQNSAIKCNKSTLNILGEDPRMSLGNNTDIKSIGKVLNVFGENLRTPLKQNSAIKCNKSTLNILGEDPRMSLGNNTDIKSIGKVLNVFGENLKTPLKQNSAIKKSIPIECFEHAKLNYFDFVDQLFVNDNVNINTKDPITGRTLLHFAILYKNCEVINKLLSLGADLESRSALFNNVPTPKELLEIMFDLNLLKLENIIDIVSDNATLEQHNAEVSGNITNIEGHN